MRRLLTILYSTLSLAAYCQGEIPRFELTRNGIEAIVLDMDSLPAGELYRRTIGWVENAFQSPDKTLQNSVANEMVLVRGYQEMVWHSKSFGSLWADMEYLLEIQISEKQLTLKFIPGEFLQARRMTMKADKKQKAVPESVQKFGSPHARTELDEVRRLNFTSANFFNRKGEVKTSFKDGKVEFESFMNKLASSLNDFIKSKYSLVDSKPTLVMPLIAMDSIGLALQREIEVFKFDSRRTIRLKPGRTVWVRAENKKGKIKVRAAEFVVINDQEMVFTPHNHNFREVTYLDTQMSYIGFTSPGRVTIAVVVNVVIIVCVVVVYLALAILARSDPSSMSGGNGKLLVPVRKNIDLIEGKWGVRVVKAKY